jgi:hypothetical protein
MIVAAISYEQGTTGMAMREGPDYEIVDVEPGVGRTRWLIRCLGCNREKWVLSGPSPAMARPAAWAAISGWNTRNNREIEAMLGLKVIDNMARHFTIYGDEPFRVEISKWFGGRGEILAEVYRGTKDNPDQEPDLIYDGDNETNVNLESPAPGITNEIFVI